MKKLIADVKKATSKYEKELKLISDAMEDDESKTAESLFDTATKRTKEGNATVNEAGI